MLLKFSDTEPTHVDATRLAAWMGQIALRDERAFAALYKATSPHLLGVAMLMMKRRERAEEVLQESFVNIWLHAGKFVQSEASPMSWLISIVRHKALDHLRKSQHADRHASIDEEEGAAACLIATEAPGPAELLSAASAQLDLQSCLESLDASLRQSLALAYYEGLSHPEIAHRLRAPLGTVKSWVRRGVERLRACLDKQQGPKR